MLTQSIAKDRRRISRVTRYAIAGGGFALGFAVFFRGQLLSRFDLLFGDRGDTRLVVFIHEHVFRAIFGHSQFLSPPFFYNFTDTLGFSDAFLLDQGIYAPLRALGADSFLGTQITIMILALASYVSLYALLRRFGKASVATSAIAALLFTFANNLYVNANHIQLFMVYYIPIIAYLAMYALAEIHHSKLPALIAGGASGLLYGLLFPTGFYIAWYFGLSLLAFISILLFISWNEVRRWFAIGPAAVGMLALAVADGFVVGLIPFVWIYVPVLKLGGSRNANEYLLYAPTFSDITNIGLNFVWSDLFAKIGLGPDVRVSGEGEQSFALTPALQLLALLSLLIGVRARYWAGGNSNVFMRAAIIAGTAVYIMLFLITIKFHEYSIFLMISKFVPGAIAIRAGYRDMIVANFFVIISVALAIRCLWLASLNGNTSVETTLARAAMVALTTLAVVEQLNLAPVSLVSRATERARFDTVGAAPVDCRSFYIAPEPYQPPTSVQIDAMMAAQKVDIPTINGYSGFFPPGWDFYDSSDDEYEQKARAWAIQRGIDSNLCRLDLATGRFAKVN